MRLSLNAVCAAALLAASASAAAYDGSSFNQVWDAVRSDPYAKPHNQVTLASFYDWTGSLIERAASRTITDSDDLLPRFTKLVHANGICLKGEWIVDGDSPYTGYFAKGSRGLIIVRGSVATSDTEQGHLRPFGFSGKMFPTLNPDEVVRTANFVAIDDLGGTMTEHYQDAPMTNEPGTHFAPQDLPIAAAISLAFIQVDSHIGIRQMYPYSEIGVADPATARTPYWFKVQGRKEQVRAAAADFRDELDLAKYTEAPMIFDIAVASTKNDAGDKNWSTIGRIELDQSVVSDSCDHRLHFHHTPWKDNVNY